LIVKPERPLRHLYKTRNRTVAESFILRKLRKLSILMDACGNLLSINP